MKGKRVVEKESNKPLSKIREICLSLADTDEAQHFGEPSFRVKKSMFATVSDKTGVWRLQVQLKPDHVKDLIDKDPRCEPYERMKDIVSMRVDKITDWNDV